MHLNVPKVNLRSSLAFVGFKRRRTNRVFLRTLVRLEQEVRSQSRLLVAPSRVVSLCHIEWREYSQYLLKAATLRSWWICIPWLGGGLLRWIPLRREPLWSVQLSVNFLPNCKVLTDSHSEAGSLEVAGRSFGVVAHSSVEVHCKILAVVGSYAADPVQGRTT